MFSQKLLPYFTIVVNVWLQSWLHLFAKPFYSESQNG